MEEVKTLTELYAKIQKVIDELDATFFSGKGKQKIPELVFAINNQCRACVTAFVTRLNILAQIVVCTCGESPI